MANRWENNRNRDRLYFLCSKVTADGDCSQESRHVLLGREAMTKLDSILKRRDITLPTKVCLVKAMVFPVVMYGYESWTIKKAEHQIIGTFELCCWRRLDWESCGLQGNQNQSILKEINPEYSLEKLTLKLQLQYYGHLIWRADSLEETLMPRKIEGRKRKGRQRVRWLDSITNSMDWVWASSWRRWKTWKPGVLQSMGSQRVRHDWATEQQ